MGLCPLIHRHSYIECSIIQHGLLCFETAIILASCIASSVNQLNGLYIFSYLLHGRYIIVFHYFIKIFSFLFRNLRASRTKGLGSEHMSYVHIKGMVHSLFFFLSCLFFLSSPQSCIDTSVLIPVWCWFMVGVLHKTHACIMSWSSTKSSTIVYLVTVFCALDITGRVLW